MTGDSVISTLIPLAVTFDADGGACVAGLDTGGAWIRPEPVRVEEVGPERPYAFFQPVRIGLGPSAEPDARPEDRTVSSPPQPVGEILGAPAREQLLKNTADPTVTEAFANERSAGLVRAEVCRVYGRRSTGGRSFLRLEFTDDSGTEYDWIVRDWRAVRQFPNPVDGPLPDLPGHCFLAVGLTKPNGRFPGRFRGCHPLVVGVHSERGDARVFGTA